MLTSMRCRIEVTNADASRLPLPAGEDPLVLSLGRLERYKRHHRVIAAMPAIRRAPPGTRLYRLYRPDPDPGDVELVFRFDAEAARHTLERFRERVRKEPENARLDLFPADRAVVAARRDDERVGDGQLLADVEGEDVGGELVGRRAGGGGHELHGTVGGGHGLIPPDRATASTSGPR